MKTRTAQWMASAGQYVVTDTGTSDEWYSMTGEDWSDQHGHPIAGEEYAMSQIILVGGARDGETVV